MILEIDIKADVATDISQMLLTPYRIFSAGGLIIFILMFTKLGLAHNLGIWFMLPVLVAGYVLLCVISVPVAVAFLITSVQLIAQVSMFHPNVSVFGALSVVVLVSSLVIRWREGILAEFSRLRWLHFLPWILLAIVFAIGFFGAVQSPHTVNSLHYVFLSHWLVYMALGILVCTSLAELKIFLIAFSLLFVVTIFPLPVDFYPYFFKRVYYECYPMGLHNMVIGEEIYTNIQAGSVNRSQVGYLAAMASLTSLSLAHHRGGSLGNMFYLWSLLAAVILFLAGSKGPVLGCVVGAFIVMAFAKNKERVRILVVAGVTASVIGFSILAGYSPLPCGTVKLYTESVSASVNSRSYFAEEVLLAKQTVALDLVFGEGFGGSARRINPYTGEALTHVGSHNLFLDLLVDTGLVGLILFVLALYILIRRFVQPLLRQDFPDRQLFMAAMGGTYIVSLTMLVLTTSTYRECLGAFLIGLLMGSAVYMVPRHPPSRSASNMASDTTGES